MQPVLRDGDRGGVNLLADVFHEGVEAAVVIALELREMVSGVL